MDWDDLEQAAIELHRRLGFDPARPRGGPALARALFGDGAIVLLPHADLAGRAELRAADNDGRRIVVRPKLSAADLNFAVCHELAEYELARANVMTEDIERMADALAACIAAPGPAVDLAFFALRWNLPRLARAFCLTETAMALRIGEVMREPIAIVRPVRIDRRGPDELPDDESLRAVVRVLCPGVLKPVMTIRRPPNGLTAIDMTDVRRRALVSNAG